MNEMRGEAGDTSVADFGGENGEFRPVPNQDTIPHEPGQERIHSESHAEPSENGHHLIVTNLEALPWQGWRRTSNKSASHGFDAKSPRLPAEALLVKVHVMVSQILDVEERAAFSKLPTGVQRSVALAADYATITLR